MRRGAAVRGSFRIARLFGIEIRVHLTFFLLVAYSALVEGRQGVRAGVFAVLSVLALFACVTLHELGHSLVARRFGAHVRDIILLPIGGMTRMLREPTRPLAELLTALAGPFVNFAIAVVIAVVLVQRLGAPPDKAYWLYQIEHPSREALFALLLPMNVFLALFNMLPALPMDGGRVLRAILSFFLGRSRATTIAAALGQVFGVGLALAGLAGGWPGLVLIGALVFFGAAQERNLGVASEVLLELTAGEVCNPAAQALAPGDDLGEVLDHALRTPQAFFPVVYGSDLIGVVLRDEAVFAASRLGLRANISQVVRRNLPLCAADTPLLEVRERVLQAGLPVVVVDGPRLLGILGPEDLARITAVSARLASAGIRRPRLPVKEEIAAPSPSVDPGES